MSEISDRDHAELLMLYKVTVDDIERAKQWGWRVAYTTIAANGAILALFSTYKHEANLCWIRGAIIILAITLMALGVNYIRHAQAGLSGFRERIKAVRKNFGDLLKSCYGESTPKKTWPLEYVVIGSTFIVVVLMFI